LSQRVTQGDDKIDLKQRTDVNSDC
jgi:hypothetical protein